MEGYASGRFRSQAEVARFLESQPAFPLRGAVVCAHCSKPLTACWSRSKTGAKHPYYMCFAKSCDRKGKAIKRDVIEGAFGDLLDGMTPKPGLIRLSRTMFRRAWDQRFEQGRALRLSAEKELAAVDKQIGALLDRIVENTSETVITAYEKRIGELERSKLLLAEKRESAGQPQRPFEEMFELAFGFLASPSKIWRSGKFDLQKLVLRLTFADHLAWCPQTGFQTPKKTTIPFKLLGEHDMRKSKMAVLSDEPKKSRKAPYPGMDQAVQS